MFKRFALLAALFAFLGSGPPAYSAAETQSHAAVLVAQALPPLFDTEAQAQAHCPKDVVVWLNIPSGIYHYRGQRWYGRTKHGAYACEREAIAVGDRATRNGQ